MNQILRIYQCGAVSVALMPAYWITTQYAPIDGLSMQMVHIGIPSMLVSSAATLSWMGAVDAVLLYTRTGRKRRHPGKLRLCLRAAPHAYGSLSLLVLSWRTSGGITDSFAPAGALLFVSRLHLMLLAPLYYCIENGKRPVRRRRDLLKKWYRLPS